MTAPARQPQTFIEPPQQSSELRELARVFVRVIGVVKGQWDREGMAPGHAYRHAATMLECYLKERYKV